MGSVILRFGLQIVILIVKLLVLLYNQMFKTDKNLSNGCMTDRNDPSSHCIPSMFVIHNGYDDKCLCQSPLVSLMN